nr:hypothetical protein [Tanacetum cinerariifolium]
TYGMAIDYCIMKEGMSTLRGRKSVPGMNSSEREMERKSENMEKMYTGSITKAKVAMYELVRIEDMVLKQWSTVKVGYNKDVVLGISHWGPKR